MMAAVERPTMLEEGGGVLVGLAAVIGWVCWMISLPSAEDGNLSHGVGEM
jgi:hypothetical protein